MMSKSHADDGPLRPIVLADFGKKIRSRALRARSRMILAIVQDEFGKKISLARASRALA